jgi:hypothetical protein
MFDADLKPGEHQILLRVSNKSNPRSLGQAVRVLDFAAN